MRSGNTRRAAYDGFAATFATEAADSAYSAYSAYNAYYDRPTVLGLLGDVTGLSVLDAGCGPDCMRPNCSLAART